MRPSDGHTYFADRDQLPLFEVKRLCADAATYLHAPCARDVEQKLQIGTAVNPAQKSFLRVGAAAVS